MAQGAVRHADMSEELAVRVREAAEAATPLRIVGGDSKARLGRPVIGEAFAVAGHCGIVDYAPSELVITARAGTPLAEVETALAEQGQMLSFEPPHLGTTATLGGTIACGLSGPRRPYAGAARDLMLGVRMINGRGEILNFGGQVMKNVAGYDVSRLQVGAQGTLGVLLDISLKVLPRPAGEQTVVLALDAAAAIARMNALAARPLPLTAAAHLDGRLWLRLAGAEPAVAAAVNHLGGDIAANGEQFWLDLRERRLPWFRARAETGAGLWRLSLPPATPMPELPGEWLLDWGGAQRWLRSDAPAAHIHRFALTAGGSATRFTAEAVELPDFAPGIIGLHRRLKAAFDPRGILNPGRLAEGL